MCFSSDDKVLVSCSHDKTIKIWDILIYKEIATLMGHINSVSSVCFSPAGRYLTSGSWDKVIKVWDVLNNFQECVTLTSHEEVVNTLSFQPIVCDLLW